jgi:ubiquinone biosynthesis protein Coq4
MWNELQMMRAGYRLLEDPTRLDQVLDVAGRLASAQNDKLAAIRAEDLPEPLRKAYKDRYIIAWDLESLRACPLGSLGRRLHQHCSAFGINPATFPARPIDTPAAYAMAHVENTHDIWHVVAGFGSDTVGELGLQAFAMAQFPNILGPFILGLAHLHAFKNQRPDYGFMMDEMCRGWLLGKRATLLLGVRWDTLFDTPLSTVQAMFGIEGREVAEVLAPSADDYVERTAAPGGARAA